ncbi:MAG: MFS transporter, partial [Candidatus Odinarchaeota archaeon]
MSEEKIKVYGYRWVVLLLFMLLNITVQILWITFATVTVQAQAYFGGVDELSIFLLSAIFMIIYIPDTFLASWLIDKYDFKIGCGIGAVLVAIFGFLRFFAGPDYLLMLIFTIGIAIGQPFVMNSITKLSGNWFPKGERTTATGLGTLSMFIGILLGFFLTPFLIVGNDLSIMLLLYGILSLIIGALFVIFAKSRPLTPPSSESIGEKVLMGEGLKKLFTNKSFWILILLYFIGLGIFNMITTYIQVILIPKNPLLYGDIFSGLVGGIMLLGGILGAIILSALSDKFQRKVVITIIALIIASIFLFVFTFVTDQISLMLSAFLFGFGLLGAAPIALEYAVDITKPVPEATSNGILMMVGQIGGIIFILGLSDLKLPSGDYLPALLLEAILLA